MKTLIPSVIFTILLVTILGMSSAYADDGSHKSADFQESVALNNYIKSYSDGTTVSHFKENTFKLTHSPTVCAAQENTVNKSLQRNLLEDTRYAVIDWSTKLNEGYGKKGPWYITYKEISFTDSIKSDPQCDILVRYFSKTSSDDRYFVGIGNGGVTYYDDVQHRAFIKILIDGLNDLQLRGVIEHELGHAFGLGHYVTSEDELVRISKGQQDSPSIMVGVVPNSNYYSITSLDVEQIKSKYGSSGFDGKSVTYMSDKSVYQSTSQAISKGLVNANLPQALTAQSSGKFLPQMIKDDTSDGTSFVGTGSVLVKDLVVGGYLTIPDSVDKSTLTYELSLSTRHNLVHAWSKGEITDGQFINSFQDLIQSGKVDLTKHYQVYGT